MDTLKKNSVVRLIAIGPSCVEAPWQEQGKDTWGIQYTWKNWKLDRAFVMDDEKWVKAKNHSYAIPIDIAGEMRNAKCPVYVAKKWSDVENTIEYPLEEILQVFPVHYFMNSVAYMFALAILEGYKRIECYGIDFRYFNELGEWIACETYEKFKAHHSWLDETHCGAFWAGVAIGKGIEVVTTKRSCLMKPVYLNDPSLYGYETSPLIQQQREGILAQRKKVELKQEPEHLIVFRP